MRKNVGTVDLLNCQHNSYVGLKFVPGLKVSRVRKVAIGGVSTTVLEKAVCMVKKRSAISGIRNIRRMGEVRSYSESRRGVGAISNTIKLAIRDAGSFILTSL